MTLWEVRVSRAADVLRCMLRSPPEPCSTTQGVGKVTLSAAHTALDLVIIVYYSIIRQVAYEIN